MGSKNLLGESEPRLLQLQKNVELLIEWNRDESSKFRSLGVERDKDKDKDRKKKDSDGNDKTTERMKDGVAERRLRGYSSLSSGNVEKEKKKEKKKERKIAKKSG